MEDRLLAAASQCASVVNCSEESAFFMRRRKWQSSSAATFSGELAVTCLSRSLGVHCEKREDNGCCTGVSSPSFMTLTWEDDEFGMQRIVRMVLVWDTVSSGPSCPPYVCVCGCIVCKCRHICVHLHTMHMHTHIFL